VLDAGVDPEGTPFIALELVEGETLATRFARGLPSPNELVDWAVQVCTGLQAAHDRDIVHREIKPSNIFLCVDGAVKVLDFGIAALRGTTLEAIAETTTQNARRLFGLSP